MLYRYGFLVLIIVLQASCTAYQLDSAQHSLRSSFARHNFEGSAELLNRMQQEQVYKGKDEVLLKLEQGMVNHFAGRYQESNNYFTTAENRIDYLYSQSISRAIKSLVVNDNSLDYDGEDYEDIYLNIFKTLNYIHLDDLESALVESRRIAFKLGQLDLKYNDLVDALSKADTTGQGTWKTGKTNVQNSAYGRYLSAILYAKTGKPDDARIEYENLLKALEEQKRLSSLSIPAPGQFRTITRPDRYNLLITGFAGRAPKKIQNDLRLYLDSADLYLKFSLPSLQMYNTQVDRVELVVNGDSARTLHLIEEMDLVAREVYKVKEPIIYARTVVRAFLKAVGSNSLSNRLEEDDETLGQIANLLGKIGQEVTEKADLRSWQTMPGKAYARVINLPEGTHNIETRYYRDGRVIYADTATVAIDPRTSLELVESIYWN